MFRVFIIWRKEKNSAYLVNTFDSEEWAKDFALKIHNETALIEDIHEIFIQDIQGNNVDFLPVEEIID